MSGKIIFNLAMSIDGYISNEDGSFDWIVGDGDNSLNTDKAFDFNEFMQDIDIVLMGSECYKQGMASHYSSPTTVYVATSKEEKDKDNIKFIKGDIVSIIQKEKENGKNIWLFGGGKVIDPFIKSDVIDEYIVGFIPTILGKGRRLFLDNNPNILLNLKEYYISDGVMIMKYTVR